MTSVERPECPYIFTADSFRKLVKYLSKSPRHIRSWWKWEEFAQQYSHLREDIEQYIETATTGDPAGAAVKMVQYFGSSREWAERVAARMRQRCV